MLGIVASPTTRGVANNAGSVPAPRRIQAAGAGRWGWLPSDDRVGASQDRVVVAHRSSCWRGRHSLSGSYNNGDTLSTLTFRQSFAAGFLMM